MDTTAKHEVDRIREAVRRPLPLAYHPLYRFYEGGSLTRRFRGLPDRGDDWWSEDWVGSCTLANNADPDGKPQGYSSIDFPGVGQRTLKEIIETLPEEMVGRRFADRWGPIGGVLVKLLSPAGQVPLHAHPTRAWAKKNLNSPYGKTEAWILLETLGDGTEPAYAGVGFRPGIERGWFAGKVKEHDNAAIRATLHRTDVHPGEVYVAHASVPHYLGPRISFIEVQEPSDHIVIPETDGKDDDGATMGLGWDLALDMIDYQGVDAERTFARARQQSTILHEAHGSREVRLFNDDVLDFFDAHRLEVQDELEVADGRFSIAVVTAGGGVLEGDFGSVTVKKGETLALPAFVPLRARAGREPLTVVRCLGPKVD